MRANYVVVDVGGVGYKVFTTNYTMGKLAGSGDVDFFIHTHVREDTLALYGFVTLGELEMFEHLISVSGIGPKAAMGILSIADADTVRAAIHNEDPSILTRVSGVGKKTAERVILELKNKVIAVTGAEAEKATADGEALEALTALGYSVSEARDALKSVPKDVSDVGERIKKAMKNLGKK